MRVASTMATTCFSAALHRSSSSVTTGAPRSAFPTTSADGLMSTAPPTRRRWRSQTRCANRNDQHIENLKVPGRIIVMNSLRLIATLAALAAFASAPAQAQEAKSLKLGFMSTMSGPVGALGVEQRRGLDMAIADLGGKIGGLTVDLA